MSSIINTGINTVASTGIGNYSGYVYANDSSTSMGTPLADFVTKKDLEERLKKIESRLAILVPDPVHLKKYEALQKAYEYYKMMEVLLTEK